MGEFADGGIGLLGVDEDDGVAEGVEELAGVELFGGGGGGWGGGGGRCWGGGERCIGVGDEVGEENDGCAGDEEEGESQSYFDGGPEECAESGANGGECNRGSRSVGVEECVDGGSE